MKSLPRVITFTLLIVAMALVPIFSGCSGAKPVNTFTGLLNLVPAEAAGTSTNEAPSWFTLIDYASYFKENGISNFNTIEELLNQLENKPHEVLLNMPSTGNSFITGYSSYAQNTTITDKYVGYNVGDIDAEILFGAPPREGTAAIGRFNPAATKNALSDQTDWPDWVIAAYTTEDYNGVTIHSWGDGFQIHLNTRLVPPHIDMLGRAMPLAVTDKYLFYHPSLETVKLMVDASQQNVESLADLPEYASIANGLSDLNAYQAMIGDESLVNGDPYFAGTYPGPRMKKFLTFGMGLGRDERGIFTALVLYHESEDDAEANVSLLRERIEKTSSTETDTPWSEIITDTQIDVEGNVLLAKLYSDSMSLWYLVYSYDTLLLHEQ